MGAGTEKGTSASALGAAETRSDTLELPAAALPHSYRSPVHIRFIKKLH